MEGNQTEISSNYIFEEEIRVDQNFGKLMQSLQILKSKFKNLSLVTPPNPLQNDVISLDIGEKDLVKVLEKLSPLEKKKEEKNSNSTNCNDSEEDLESRFNGTLFIYPNELDFARVYKGSTTEKEINIYNFTENKLELEIFIEGSFAIIEGSSEITSTKFSVEKSGGKLIKIKVATDSLEDNAELIGNVWILSEEGDYKIVLKAIHCIPFISCPRMLNFTSQNTDIIKLASKRSVRTELRLRLKNHCEYPLAVDLELFHPNEKGKKDVVFLGTMVRTFPPNGIAFPTLIVKKNGTTDKEIKRILIVRIRNSTIYYSFPIIIELF